MELFDLFLNIRDNKKPTVWDYEPQLGHSVSRYTDGPERRLRV